MRNFFPFSDYDFYGYLTGGFAIMLALDFAFNDGFGVLHSDWTFVQVVLAVAFAYIVGQLAAWPSSILLQNFLAHTLLRSPFEVQVGAVQPRFIERIISTLIAGRDYRRLGDGALDNMINRASEITGSAASYFREKPEELYSLAYAHARKAPDTRQRMDSFRNLYGLTRNLAFAGFLSAVLLAAAPKSEVGHDLRGFAIIALVAGIGMLARYLKFYCAFASEVTRSFAYGDEKGVAKEKL
jgi:hypothetical protein